MIRFISEINPSEIVGALILFVLFTLKVVQDIKEKYKKHASIATATVVFLSGVIALFYSAHTRVEFEKKSKHRENELIVQHDSDLRVINRLRDTLFYYLDSSNREMNSVLQFLKGSEQIPIVFAKISPANEIDQYAIRIELILLNPSNTPIRNVELVIQHPCHSTQTMYDIRTRKIDKLPLGEVEDTQLSMTSILPHHNYRILNSYCSPSPHWITINMSTPNGSFEYTLTFKTKDGITTMDGVSLYSFDDDKLVSTKKLYNSIKLREPGDYLKNIKHKQ